MDVFLTAVRDALEGEFSFHLMSAPLDAEIKMETLRVLGIEPDVLKRDEMRRSLLNMLTGGW